MKLDAQFSPLADVQSDWLIVGIWENEPLSDPLAALDVRLDGLLSSLVQAGDVTGKANEVTPLLGPRNIAAQRLLVLGLGSRATVEAGQLHAAAASAARAITEKQRERVAIALPERAGGLSAIQVALAVGSGLMHGCQGPGLRQSEPGRFVPHDLWLMAPPSANQDEIRQGAARAAIEGRAVALARELVNSPPCDLYPQTFAERAGQVAKTVGLECEIFDEKRLEAERMGALLAVARGSERPPRLVVLRHRGGQKGPTLGLIGKGVTFDSGGLSLKTNDQMVDMKCDMAGAATVLGAMAALAEEGVAINALGVLALVENMPGGRAMKLGDVLRARNGKTIEVLNTDAEGRLILADALAFAVDQKVDHLVDLATLTGACMVALGTDVAGLMSNNEGWSQQVLSAARQAGEKVWPLPMWPHYDELIKSSVADMKNTGGTRYGGAITAAKLLEQFVGTVPWVHLDIAGPAWAEHENAVRDAGGTGCFVRTLVELGRRYAS